MRKRFLQENDMIVDAYRLAAQVYTRGFRPNFIVGIWRGGSSVGIAVQECLQHLGVATDHISIRTSYRGMQSYQDMIDNAERIRVHGTQYLLDRLNADDRLLIVDDVFGSGLSVEAVIRLLLRRLKRNMPAQVKVAVPWYKPALGRTQRAPDFYLYETDDWLVFPYELSGLSLDEIRAHKPYVWPILEPVLARN